MNCEEMTALRDAAKRFRRTVQVSSALLAELLDERDQALIRAEAAEADVATLRRQLAEAETELEHVRGEFADAVGYEAAS